MQKIKKNIKLMNILFFVFMLLSQGLIILGSLIKIEQFLWVGIVVLVWAFMAFFFEKSFENQLEIFEEINKGTKK